MVEVVAMLGDDVVDVRHVDDSRPHRGYRIGRARDVDLAVDIDDHELLAWTENGFVVRGGPGVAIAAGEDLPIQCCPWITARIGPSIRVFVRRVSPAPRIPARVTVDEGLVRATLASIFVHAVLFGFVAATPVALGSIATRPMHGRDVYEEAIGSAVRLGGPASREHRDDVTDNDRSGHDRSGRDRHDSPNHDPSGNGLPTRIELGEHTVAAPGERVDAHEALRRTIEAARIEGIVGSSSIAAPDAFREVTGAIVAEAFGTAARGSLGNGGIVRGTFGEARGSSVGAGGTIGTSRYGTIGNGTVAGDGWGTSGRGGVGGGLGGLRGHVETVPTVILCGHHSGCVVTGGLDKEVIRRYIRRNLDKVQYCFERRLLVKPDLEGEVSTEFLIGSDGVVDESTATGVDDELSSCVAMVMRDIAFPRSPQATQVHYPFVFRRSG